LPEGGFTAAGLHEFPPRRGGCEDIINPGDRKEPIGVRRFG